MPTTGTARERARTQITGEILAAARARLAVDGAGGLSLRAVARDVGMVSSAVYRYFASRDELLTALIVEAYDDLGSAAESAEAGVRRTDQVGRWLALTRAVRQWALTHPQQYALLFGSPVPGYRAPETTIASGTRVPALVAAVFGDLPDVTPPPRMSRAAHTTVQQLRQDPLFAPVATAPDWRVAAGVTAWATLMGAVSLELFGQFGPLHPELSALFDHQMRSILPG